MQSKTKTKTKTIALCGLLLLALGATPTQFSRATAQCDTIKAFAELENIRSNLDGCFVLANDITMPEASRYGEGFRPIGSPASPFTGKLMGKDAKVVVIRGLYIKRPREGNVGLFGAIGRSGEVSHIGVIADEVTGRYAVGTLAGTNDGWVEGCFGAGSVLAEDRPESNAGGLVGVNTGNVRKSYSAANVRGRERVGGLVGLLTVASAGKIVECYSTGEVSGLNYAGGLVGYVFSGSIEKSFSTSKVIGLGRSSTVGGLVGGDYAELNSAWNVRGKNSAGSYVKDAVINNCFWDVTMSGLVTSGGTGGAGKTTTEMADTATFQDWDFEQTWDIPEGAIYPQLQEARVHKVAYRAGLNGKLQTDRIEGLTDTCVMLVEEGTRMEITAVPNVNYRFSGWSDGWTKAEGESLADNARSDIIVRDTIVTALFTRITTSSEPDPVLVYRVENASAAFGTLRVNIAGAILESPVYSMTVPRGSTGYVIEAIPHPGSSFLYWTDGVQSSVRADVATKNTEFTAVFRQDDVPHYTYMYTSGREGGLLKMAGSADTLFFFSSGANPVVAGTVTALFAALPHDGYRFTRWNDGHPGLTRSDTINHDMMVFMAVFQPVTGVRTIASIEDLGRIGRDAGFPLDGNYALGSNISTAGTAFTPIGSADNPFTGTFNGRGFRITGLRINVGDYAGLFAHTRNADIRNLYVEATVTGGHNVGVLAGKSENTVIVNCGAGGSANGAGNAVGGMAGNLSASLIYRSYSAADATASGANAGGIAGASAGSIITQCRSSRAGLEIRGASGVGGLVGSNTGGAAQYSYAHGNVRGPATGGSAIGGFVGEAHSGAKITQCYSTGYVGGGGTQIGGFAGALDASSEITASFWDTDISERGASAGGTGKSTGELMYSMTFLRDGWNFEEVWGITGQGANYPHLRALGNTPGHQAHNPAPPAAAVNRQIARITNRTLAINAPAESGMTVRLVDMRGRTVARYNANGSARISLARVPAGNYIMEVRDKARRVEVSKVALR